MVSGFEVVDEKYIQELTRAKLKSTKKSMKYWKNVFKKWDNERNLQPNLEDYQSDVLDQALSQFHDELQKENGDDYEPDCLKVMERYLKSKASLKSIIQGREFLNSRKVLDDKNKKPRKQGKGKRPNRSKEEKKVLWQNGQLGGDTPQALLNTMWWLLTWHFDLRGRQEHHQFKVEDFTLQRDYDGNEFLTFAEGPTKMRQGQTIHSQTVSHRE